MTYFGVIFLGFFLFVLLLDAFGKGKFIKSKGPLKKILLFVVIIVAIIAISLGFIYK